MYIPIRSFICIISLSVPYTKVCNVKVREYLLTACLYDRQQVALKRVFVKLNVCALSRH